MTRLSPEICLKIKEARKQAKLSQSEVAAEVGCKQSALSMFEQGDGTKLNDVVIEKLAKKFGVELKVATEQKAKSDEAIRSVPVYRAEPTRLLKGFCPNPQCPSNVSYEIGGRLFLKPNCEQADPVGGKFCAICGEVLEKHCPNCGAPVHAGGFCSFCGDPYVTVA